MSLVGIIGSVLILIAWIFETEESIRRHKDLIDLKFAIVYISGCVFLTIYAVQINDTIFFVLQILITLLIIFEIVYTVYEKRIRKRYRWR